MIVFDLECAQGHTFEGWFDSLDAFEEQQARSLVACPSCGDTHVRRVLSPIAVSRPRDTGDTPAAIDYPRLAREVLAQIEKNFENVGSRFAAEALKIHYGVKAKRNIRGSATENEERILKDEGIEFFKLPVPKLPAKKEN